MGTIEVVNKYKHTSTDSDVYIGRGSVFGSPFSHIQSNHVQLKKVYDTREEAVRAYKDYFNDIVGSCGCKHKDFKNKLRELVLTVRLGDNLNLVCLCKPKICHGDVIKAYVLNQLKVK